MRDVADYLSVSRVEIPIRRAFYSRPLARRFAVQMDRYAKLRQNEFNQLSLFAKARCDSSVYWPFLSHDYLAASIAPMPPR